MRITSVTLQKARQVTAMTDIRKASMDGGETRLLHKNVVVMSVAFMILFTAFQSMSALQSSINKVRSLK